MQAHYKTILLVIVLIIIAGLVASGRRAVPTPAPTAVVAFACDGKKGIIATFYKGEPRVTSLDRVPKPGGSVALALSDGRMMTLPQTISADGGRYANADESFVFWGKGNGALVLEGGKEHNYTGCIVIAPDQPGHALPLIYSSSAARFSLRIPAGYLADESYRYIERGPGKEILGVKFTVATTTAAGTNLSADSYLSVEAVAANDCSATLFLDRAKAVTVTDGSMTYSVASTTGAAAGNRYEETVYAIPGTSPCYAVRYFVHYGVFENYPAGTVKRFDAQALRNEFDAIRHTLVLQL